MEWLKKLLEKHGAGAELMTAIMADTQDTNYIPKERFDEVNNQLKDLKTQIADRDKQLKDLGEKAKGNEDLSKQILELQETNKKAKAEYEDKLKNITLDNAIRLRLKDSKAKYDDLLMSKFDREKLKVKDDGSIEGLDEQLSTIKDGYKDLFEQPLSGREPNNTGGSQSTLNPWKKESFNLTQQGKIFKENPELAKSLMHQAGITTM
ncbi:phage scaffolding protein [Clostridium sp. 19966]|uniref:phage scaffolding protein n=1 Tax=Clostridium sp. 19966 TaxID=2768166 RepID=UPI0028E09E97|nr:phage scaffolding protein [Clostridium sp. 19966]MDT8715444.1 phage scaffolding protein [Clostridium sp. 19966]